jgi:hypothetical protein
LTPSPSAPRPPRRRCKSAPAEPPDRPGPWNRFSTCACRQRAQPARRLSGRQNRPPSLPGQIFKFVPRHRRGTGFPTCPRKQSTLGASSSGGMRAPDGFNSALLVRVSSRTIFQICPTAPSWDGFPNLSENETDWCCWKWVWHGSVCRLWLSCRPQSLHGQIFKFVPRRDTEVRTPPTLWINPLEDYNLERPSKCRRDCNTTPNHLAFVPTRRAAGSSADHRRQWPHHPTLRSEPPP